MTSQLILFIFVTCVSALTIVIDDSELVGSSSGLLAAKELRRYVFVSKGRSAEIVGFLTAMAPQYCDEEMVYIIHNSHPLVHQSGIRGDLSTMGPEGVRILSLGRHIIHEGNCTTSNLVVCSGVHRSFQLRCAYRLAEELGVRFALHGDIIPDMKLNSGLLFSKLDIIMDPLFPVRGLQPYHDFPDGVDWWTMDDFKVILTQINKMGMNFIGFHTYCKTDDYCEPTVWVGLKEDVNDDGTVKKAYRSAYASTLRGSFWGYTAENTSDYKFGGKLLFESDCYGSEVQQGACPQPLTLEQSIMVFNQAGAFWREVVEYARSLGIRTAVGNQAPLSDWHSVNTTGMTEEYYEGIFTRIEKAYPVDYYWLWMPESWLDGSDQVEAVTLDIKAMQQAYETVKPSFGLATCGWTPGPSNNRTYIDAVLPGSWLAVSSLDAHVGMEPPDPAFKQIKHNKWIIPWLEDDPGLTAPQLWVNRTLEHINLALEYKAEGLLAIHWRTRDIAPQLMAMSKALYEAGYTSEEFWIEWANSEFGPEIAGTAAEIFSSIESFRLPRPVNWDSKSQFVEGGPGSMSPDQSQCDWSSKYAFLDDLQALRESVKGPAATDRLQYWLYSFRYMRAIAMTECIWALLADCVSLAENATNPDVKREIANKTCLPLRVMLVENATDMMSHLLQKTGSSGEMGTFTNIHSHSGPGLIFCIIKAIGRIHLFLPCVMCFKAFLMPLERY
jgi:hypothetical protein